MTVSQRTCRGTPPKFEDPVFSLRDEFGAWDPRRQRPELWNLYNGRHRPGEHVRVFPLSNWTELDVWQCIAREDIELPAIYFAHEREVFRRDGMWLSVGEWGGPKREETVEKRLVRFRKVGDMSCTGAVDSDAVTLAQIIAEIAASRLTERGATRADDKVSEAAMEDRKRRGLLLTAVRLCETAGRGPYRSIPIRPSTMPRSSVAGRVGRAPRSPRSHGAGIRSRWLRGSLRQGRCPQDADRC